MRELVIFFAGVATGIFWIISGAAVGILVGKMIAAMSEGCRSPFATAPENRPPSRPSRGSK